METKIKKSSQISRATLQEIADRVGVTRMTVSRVLNGNIQLTQPKAIRRAQEIKRIAEELGYKPNLAAFAMVKGRFDAISLVLAGKHQYPGRSWLPREMLDGLSDGLEEKGKQLLLTVITDEHFQQMLRIPKTLRTLCVDGLVVNYIVSLSSEFKTLLESSQLPIVMTNYKQENNAVYPDEIEAGRKVTEYLLSIGHRRIAFLGDIPCNYAHFSSLDRLEGYKQTMEQAGYSPQWISVQREFVSNPMAQKGREWLEKVGDATAVICALPTDALQLYIAALAAGKKVPGDLSIVTFCEKDRYKMEQVYFSHYQVPFEMVGRKAAEMILYLIDERKFTCPSWTVSGFLQEGETSSPPQIY